MSETDQARKIANEALQKGEAVAEETARAVEQSYSAMFKNVRDFNVKMMEMARGNAEAIFEFAGQLATAKTPAELMELWAAHSRKQFEMLSVQIQELTTLGQKIANENAEPMTRGVNQVLKKAS